MHGLAAVPITVFGAGAWGTVSEVFNAMKVCGVSENSSYEAAVAGGLAQAFVLAALGLLIGLAVWTCHRHLKAQVDLFTTEMDVACYDLAARLGPKVLVDNAAPPGAYS
jgi:biopolymer transport protein ExbB/TolQ